MTIFEVHLKKGKNKVFRVKGYTLAEALHAFGYDIRKTLDNLDYYEHIEDD